MVLLDVVKFFEIIYKKETMEEGIGGINGIGKNTIKSKKKEK